jgi:hypothetical protein
MNMNRLLYEIKHNIRLDDLRQPLPSTIHLDIYSIFSTSLLAPEEHVTAQDSQKHTYILSKLSENLRHNIFTDRVMNIIHIFNNLSYSATLCVLIMLQHHVESVEQTSVSPKYRVAFEAMTDHERANVSGIGRMLAYADEY